MYNLRRKRCPCEEICTIAPDLRTIYIHIPWHGVDSVAVESTGVDINAIRTVLRQSGMRAVVVPPVHDKSRWRGARATPRTRCG